MGGLVKSGVWRGDRGCCKSVALGDESPDFDNPPIPPTPPMIELSSFHK